MLYFYYTFTYIYIPVMTAPYVQLQIGPVGGFAQQT